MLVQRRRRWPNIISYIGPMYWVIWVVAFLATGDESVTHDIAIAAK